jgi:hypothetical protein
MLRRDGFSSVAHAALTKTAAPALLASKPAVVFERIARGGGATNWYFCRGPQDLPALEAKLSPGSVVSFYFDERIRRAPKSSTTEEAINTIVDETGDAVVAVFGADPIAMDAELISSRGELSEYLSTQTSSELFFGPTPGRDNDGERSVTLTLPDTDGIVRGHPH